MGTDELHISAMEGSTQIRDLSRELGQHLYPDNADSTDLFFHLSEANFSSQRTASLTGSLTGGVGDSLMHVVDAGKSSVKSYINLCNAYGNLQDLATSVSK